LALFGEDKEIVSIDDACLGKELFCWRKCKSCAASIPGRALGGVIEGLKIYSRGCVHRRQQIAYRCGEPLDRKE